jgi:hypothetical protein
MVPAARDIPRPASLVARFEPVLSAWSALARAGQVDFDEDGVSREEFEAFKRATGGGRLPSELRALYEISRSGFELDEAAIQIKPWPPEWAVEYGVEEQGFPLPDQMQVFGDDTGDNVWTFWLQRGPIPDHPPVLVIEDFDVYSIRSAGDITAFLKFETAVSLISMDDHSAVREAFDALGLPPELRVGSVEDSDHLTRVAHWADPMAARYGFPYYGARNPLAPNQLEGLTRDLP